MNRKISFSTYRSIDIAIFTGLMVLFEFFSVRGFDFFNGIYSLSLFLVLSLITMLRWKAWAIIPVVVGGATYALAHPDGTIQNVIVYVVGNLFVLIALVWIIKGQDKLKNNYYLILFVLTGFFGYCIGRTILGSIVFNVDFVRLLIGNLGTESLNALLSLIVIFIARKQPGILDNQKNYVERVQEEEKQNSLEVEE